MRRRNRATGPFDALMVVAFALTAGCGGAGQAGKPDAVPGQAAVEQAGVEQSVIERGKYLASIGGCNDCHTPLKLGPTGPEPDMSRYLAGHPQELKIGKAPTIPPPWTYLGSVTNTAYAGPWGVSYAINLTPDAETGLGTWSEQVFINSLKTGRHMGVGRPILPPMPWQGYSAMTDDDLKALFAYLRSVEPRKNAVPEAELAGPPPGSTPPPVAPAPSSAAPPPAAPPGAASTPPTR